MLRLTTATQAQWLGVLQRAAAFRPGCGHPAVMEVRGQTLVYLHQDGYDDCFRHATLSRNRTTGAIILRQGKHPSARSELASYRILNMLLRLDDLP